MQQFGFYKIGRDVTSPLSVVVLPDLESAKREACRVIKEEGLDAIRIWIDGRSILDVKRPARLFPTKAGHLFDHQEAAVLARKSQGVSLSDIGIEFGMSVNQVRRLIVCSQERVCMFARQPNRAVLSARASNALSLLIKEPEEDLTERDERLPSRVAALTRQEIGRVPNVGRDTIAEIEAWLWDRGLALGCWRMLAIPRSR